MLSIHKWACRLIRFIAVRESMKRNKGAQSRPLLTHSMKTLSRSSMCKTVAMLPTKNTLTNILSASVFSYDIFICLILIWTTNGQLDYNKLQRITLDIFVVMYCIVRFCVLLSGIRSAAVQCFFNIIYYFICKPGLRWRFY